MITLLNEIKLDKNNYLDKEYYLKNFEDVLNFDDIHNSQILYKLPIDLRAVGKTTICNEFSYVMQMLYPNRQIIYITPHINMEYIGTFLLTPSMFVRYYPNGFDRDSILILDEIDTQSNEFKRLEGVTENRFYIVGFGY